jgi:hypothetical protein
VARLVEKRTLVFLTLAMLVWAVSISSLAGYFYLQNATYVQQIGENQQSLNKAASNYDGAMSKYNTLLSEYSVLYYSYSSPNANFTLLMEPFGRLMDNLRSNYSSLLMNQEDLNETYYTLEEKYQPAYQEGSVTREDFEELLNEYYELFNLLAIRELSIVVSETVTLTVNISVDYGNETVEWYNETVVPAGSSLFQLTQEIATVDPKYNQWAKPGHIFIEAINDKEGSSSDHIDEGYSDGYSWMWYYWDSDQQKWVSGPVGCDAWMLKDGGIYKWSFEYWRFDWPWS